MSSRPDINMSRIAVGGGAAGAIFAIGSVCLFLVGVPFARWFLLGAIPFGVLVALLLFLLHEYKPVRIIEVLPPTDEREQH